MKKSLSIAILCCFPVLAFAEPQWKVLGENGNGSVFYIDMRHAITQQDHTAWLKTEMGNPITINGKLATSVISKVEFDCENGLSRKTHSYFFSKNQVNIDSYTKLDALFEEIVPGSFDDTVRELVCIDNAE